MKLDPDIHIAMHLVLSLKPGVTRGAPGPRPGGMLVLRTWEVRTDAGRSRNPMGGPSPRLLARSFPSSGTRGVTGPVPEWGAGPGPLAR